MEVGSKDSLQNSMSWLNKIHSNQSVRLGTSHVHLDVAFHGRYFVMVWTTVVISVMRERIGVVIFVKIISHVIETIHIDSRKNTLYAIE